MSTHDRPASHDAESLIGRVASEYFDRVERGEQPRIEEYAKRYPEIADVIEQVFPALGTIGKSAAGGEINSHRDATNQPEQPFPQTIGDFRILREIGRGGMGIVYEAEQLSMDRTVALKVLPLACMLDDKRLARFHNEVRAAAALNHPNIVAIYSVGEEQGIHFYAMQLVRGQSVAQVVERLRVERFRLSADSFSKAVAAVPEGRSATNDDRHDPSADGAEQESAATASVARSTTHARPDFYRAIARLGRQVAEALHHAHEHGVVHRDIKPANLLLDGEGKIWITDFGLARIEQDAGLTLSGDLLGTVRYMAPEQAAGDQAVVDYRADVYALGVTLYELATLRPAVVGTGNRELLKRVAEHEPVAPRKLAPSISVELATIITKAIEKNPADRYPSAAAMADDLGRFLDDMPIQAKPPTLVDRVVKWSRRHSDLAWAAVVAMLLATLGASVAAVLLNRSYRDAERHRQISDRMRIDAANHRTALQREVYSLDMQAAFDAWSKGRIDRVDGLLEKHKPRDGDADVRGFSWYALKEMTMRPPPIVVHGARGGVHETMIQRPALRVMEGHQGAVREVAVHPDGKRLVTVGDDGTIRTWDIKSGALLTTIHTGNKPLNALSVAPDGQSVVTGTSTLEQWDLESGERMKALATFDTTIEEVAFSPDGAYVASGSRDSIVRLIALGEGKSRRFDVQSGNESLVFTDRGTALSAICKKDDARHRLRSWDIASGRTIRDLYVEGNRGSAMFASTRRSQRLVILGGEGQLSFWNSTVKNAMETTPAVSDSLLDIAVSPDNRLVVSGSKDGNLRIWRLAPNWVDKDVSKVVWGPHVVLPAHRGAITSVVFVDKHCLATCGADGLIRIWKIGRPKLRSRYFGERYQQATFTPDARALLGITRHGRLELQDIESNKTQWATSYPRSQVAAIEFACGGKRFATFTEDDAIDVWDFDPLKRVATFEPPYDINRIALSPAGDLAAATCVDGYTAVWDVEASKSVLNRKLLAGWGRAVEFSPQGNLMALGGGDSKLLVLRTGEWNVVHRLRGVSDVRALAFNARGTRLASAHEDHLIRIWDISSGQLELELDARDFGRIYSLAFHPAKDLLASGTLHETVSLWHLPTRKRHGALFPSYASKLRYAREVAFSPDGRTIFAYVARQKYQDRSLLALETDYPGMAATEPVRRTSVSTSSK